MSRGIVVFNLDRWLTPSTVVRVTHDDSINGKSQLVLTLKIHLSSKCINFCRKRRTVIISTKTSTDITIQRLKLTDDIVIEHRYPGARGKLVENWWRVVGNSGRADIAHHFGFHSSHHQVVAKGAQYKVDCHVVTS